MTLALPYRWSHIGLCVSNLEKSMRFYCEGLGFEPAERYELDESEFPGLTAALEAEVPAVIVSQMITHGSLKIELLGWQSQTPQGVPSSRRDHLGLTHLSFYVDDLDQVIERLVGLGGCLLPKTRQSPGADLVFVADPDGTRVELMANQ